MAAADAGHYNLPPSPDASYWLFPNCANFSDLWQLLQSNVFFDLSELPSLRLVLLYAQAFIKSASSECYAFVSADTCDGTLAALFFAVFCVYLLIARSREQRERDSAAAVVKQPAVKISPALAGQAFWDKYDTARGWQSTIGGVDKTSHLAGGKNSYSRPLDALLPRREYVPKKRAWEGSGTASKDIYNTIPAPLPQGEQAEQVQGARGREKGVEEVIDWERTRQLAAATPELWNLEFVYHDWSQTYNTNFRPAGSLAASGMLLEPLGHLHGLLEINRQFYRDVTSGGMIRLSNRPLPDREVVADAVKAVRKRLRAANLPTADISDKFEHHLARFAWHGLVRIVEGDVQLAHEIASVANQNLGIACYEQLVHHFANVSTPSDDAEHDVAESLAVLQTGEHFLNISQVENGDEGKILNVRFEGLFKLVPFSLLDGLGVDALDDDLVRAVVATAELRLPLRAAASGQHEGATTRFVIHHPIQNVVVPKNRLSSRENLEAEQLVWIQEWLISVLTLSPEKSEVRESRGGGKNPEVAVGAARADSGNEGASPTARPAERVRDATSTGLDLRVWTVGKERLLARLMAEGFSREASLRAIIALSGTSYIASPDAADDSVRELGVAETQIVPKSTAKLTDCLLWLCERLGDSTTNGEMTEDELSQLALTAADLNRLSAAAEALQKEAEAAAAEAAADAALKLANPPKRVFYRDAAVEDAINAAAKDAAAKEAAAVASADPWRVLEKASEAAAAAAAKKVREEMAEKRSAKAHQKGFNKGYQS